MQKKRPMAATLLLLISLSACAALSIKTWQFDADHVRKECQDVEPLVRLKGGQVQEALTVAKAHGYRCYSEQDDSAWREELKIETACCDGKQALR